MMKQLLLIGSVLVGGLSAHAAGAGSGDRWVTPDFVIAHGGSVLRTGAVTDCRANIREVICLAKASSENEPISQRKCLPGGEAYASAFEALYDEYPPALQKMFCSLRRIFVEQEFYGSAYAGLEKDKAGRTLGAVLGVRQSLLDQPMSLAMWASWKEQLSFGGIYDHYELTPGLPTINVSTDPVGNDFLYFVLAHEFGHMFDFTNAVNDWICPKPGQDPFDDANNCIAKPGTWSALSWLSTSTVDPGADFYGRKDLCFYSCDGKAKLGARDSVRVYDALLSSRFISLYAATNPYDDFAELVAYQAITERLHARYSIRANPAWSFDVSSILEGDAIWKKAKYVHDLFSRGDLRYP